MLGRIDVLRVARPELGHCFAAMVGDDEPRHVPLHAATLSLFERIDRLEAGPHRATWRRLAGALATFPDTPDCVFKAAVLTNMLGVIALGDAEDYQHTEALVRRFGHQRVAQVQDQLDGLLEVGPDLPLTTAVCHELARRTRIEHRLVRAGRAEADAAAVAAACRTAAFWLVLVGVKPDQLGRLPADPDELRHLVEKRGVAGWREVIAVIAANPWGPGASGVAELARAADLPLPAEVVEQAAKVYRRRFEEAERLDVANEIRRLVAISGCSQRQFAAYVGTSPSRLSTYVNGLVTPSAAMMLRISRAASVLAQTAGGLHT